MSNVNSKSIIIIGGGIGGLYAAWKLSETGYHVILLERENFLGGLSTSITLNGCVMDIGPHFVSLEKNSDPISYLRWKKNSKQPFQTAYPLFLCNSHRTYSNHLVNRQFVCLPCFLAIQPPQLS